MSEVVKLTIVPEPNGSPAEQGAKNLTVGERLALARSAQELSVEQVAGQLKWSARQIAEIEAGHYSVFPDMLTVRGFVRTYAKILKIDSTLLLQDLAAEYEKLPAKPLDRPKLDTPFPTGRMPLLGRHHNNSQKIMGGAILLVLCLLAVFVWRAELLHFVRGIYPVSANPVADQIPTAEIKAGSPGNLNSSSSVEVNNPIPESKGDASPKIPPVSPVDSHHNVSVPVVASLNAKASEVRQDGTQFEPQKNPQTAEFSVADSLVLRFNQDSWVQIKRLNGSVVISRLYKAGTEEVVGVNEPLNMVIGNAPGVDAKLRGQNLNLPAQPGSNVVNLSIK